MANVASCELGAAICRISPETKVCEDAKVNVPVADVEKVTFPTDVPFLYMMNVAVDVDAVPAFAADPVKLVGNVNDVVATKVSTYADADGFAVIDTAKSYGIDDHELSPLR